MTSAAPLLFDRALARVRLGRALRGAYPGFLLERAAAELEERLAVVTRQFDRALDLGTPTAAAAEVLRRAPNVGDPIRLAPAAGPPAGIPTALADEELLPIAPGALDLAVSLLSLQGVNDLPGTLVQIRRALRPDGLFLACLLGGETLRELRDSFAAAESEVEGGTGPRVAPFADVRSLGGLLQRAGLALPVADLDRVVVRYGTPLALVADLRAMGLANAMIERRRTPMRRETLVRAMGLYAERHADPDGRVRTTFDLVWLSGWAPHADQQKPLRPGSARMRLADALGTRELGPDAAT